MSPSEKKPNAREQLLEAARKLFMAKGFDAVSTREIAEAAEVNLASIQYYFGSKGKLFVEVVTCLMKEDRPEQANAVLERECFTPLDAAASLTAFIRLFLEYLLLHKDPKPCQMMVRELFSESGRDEDISEVLVSTVVSDFIAPLDEALMRILRKITPAAPEPELAIAVNSIVGQCLFYMSHGPFISKQWQRDITEPGEIEKIAMQVSQFSLKGLGADQQLMAAALEAGRALAEAARGSKD